jgi:DNA repair exonuclease SbcCD ATPase subunit
MNDIVEMLRADLPLGCKEGMAEAAADEIERLREENDQLKIRIGTYYAGNADGGTVKRLEAEIERLREELADATAKPYAFCIEPRSEILSRQQAEIERLRGLLREGLRPWPLAVSDEDGSNMRSWRDDWERRVREALGGQ